MWYIARIDNDTTGIKWHDAYEKLRELNDLIYKMWMNDLISDKIKEECYEVTKELGWEIMKKCKPLM